MLAAKVVFPALALAGGAMGGVESSGSAAVSAGGMDSDSGLNFEGAYAVMLGGGFGFQLDGLHSSIGSTEFTGGGAQLFWQNDSPWLASLGYSRVHGEFVDSDEISSGLQFQQSWYSVGGKIGFARIDYAGQVPFIDDKDNGLLMEIHVDFHVSETLRASLGVEHRFDLFFAKAEVEWLTPVDGLSVFTNVMVGENQYDHALVGLRYHFGGESRSLKGRRETPRAMSPGVLYGVGNYGALYNSKGREFLAANQGVGFSGGSGNYGSVKQNAGYGSSVSIITVGSGTLTVGGSGSLSGSGTVGSGSLTMGNGVLGPGSSPWSLVNAGNLTLSGGSSMDLTGAGTLALLPGWFLLGPATIPDGSFNP